MDAVTLRPYQQEAMEALLNWFRKNPTGNPCMVMPVGSGKSWLLAETARQYLRHCPGKRVLALAARRELLTQNHEKMVALLPEVETGIYSAGLNRREIEAKVLVAGIQSIYRKGVELQDVGMVLIDECDLIRADDEGMYHELFKSLPSGFRAVGFTATPFRLNSGSIIGKDSFFCDIAHEAPMAELTRQGYLSPLKSKASRLAPNLSDVRIRAGEYVAEGLEAAFNRPTLTHPIMDEIETLGKDRKSWLIFCSGVSHTENVARALRDRGHEAECVTGETGSLFREQHIQQFKEGKLKCLVGCEIFTVGFDAPNIDFIVLLRATQSVRLLIQMIGRGSRMVPGKETCLIADYGGNLERHGPIDRVKIRKRWNPVTDADEHLVEKEAGKTCPVCRSFLVWESRECADCGYVFPGRAMQSLSSQASTAPVMAADIQTEEVSIKEVRYTKHEKKDKPPSLRIMYVIDSVNGIPRKTVNEFLCFEHEGYAAQKARQIWRARTREKDRLAPVSIDEALERAVKELPEVTAIKTRKDGKWDRVIEVITERQTIWDKFFEETGVNI